MSAGHLTVMFDLGGLCSRLKKEHANQQSGTHPVRHAVMMNYATAVAVDVYLQTSVNRGLGAVECGYFAL